MSEAASPIPEPIPEPAPERVVEYPSSDGRPVGETDLHYDRLTDVAAMLKHRYGHRTDVYVGANLLVYDTEGNWRRHLSPDVFVVFGVPNHRRDVFKLWEERPPAFILEITSKSTRGEDERTKRRRYAQWGVAEYFLYDPRAEYLDPPLRGLELGGRGYRRMPERTLPNGARGHFSEALGLWLWLRDGELRLHDPATGADLLTPAERADAATVRAETEAAHAKMEAARADTEAARAETEAARAETEARARARAEARVRELEARLRDGS